MRHQYLLHGIKELKHHELGPAEEIGINLLLPLLIVVVREAALGDTELVRLEISGLAVLLGVPCRTAGATSKFA